METGIKIRQAIKSDKENKSIIVFENNFAEVEKRVREKIEECEKMVYTPEAISSAKTDVAALRKEKILLNDTCIEAEKIYLEPFEIGVKVGRAKLNELYDRGILSINTQIKTVESKIKEEKKETILNYFNEQQTEGVLIFEDIFDERWLNFSTSLNKIKAEIDGLVETVEKELETIRVMKSEKEVDAINLYKKTRSLASAIQMINAYEVEKATILARERENQRIDAERKKNEAEAQKRAEEQARIDREKNIEAEKQAAIEEAKAEERKKIGAEILIARAEEKRIADAEARKQKEAADAEFKIQEEERKKEEIRIAKENQEKLAKGEKRYGITITNLTRVQVDGLSDALEKKEYTFNCFAE